MWLVNNKVKERLYQKERFKKRREYTYEYAIKRRWEEILKGRLNIINIPESKLLTKKDLKYLEKVKPY